MFKFQNSPKQFFIVLFDFIVFIFVTFLTLSLNSDTLGFSINDIFIILSAPIIAIPIFLYFGIYRVIVRYIGFDSIIVIFKAISIYSILWTIFAQIISIKFVFLPVLINHWCFSIILIIGSRIIGKRFALDHGLIRSNSGKNVVVYGAGSAGRQLVIALSHSIEYNPVAFLDDSSEFQNKFIDHIEVYHPNCIEKLIKSMNVDEVLLAIPSASRDRRNEIIKFLDSFPVFVRALPGVAQIAQGKVKIDDLYEINIKDLLGREPAPSDEGLLSLNIKEKVVMVTGAGGSIGSELCRQIILLEPTVLVLYELSEFALYQIEKELSSLNITSVKILPFLGSVVNKKRLNFILQKTSVQTIYHAAAYKHVPIVEMNTIEGVNNNIFGTLNCALAAIKANVETFVLVSSDKAVRPTNVMGATKRFSEMILQALSDQHFKTRFSMVRFGNVLGSSGSVIPLFTKQIKNGGPVTVTDSNMTRYFMTISEAVGLVIQAGAMGKGGNVFVLNMGEPVNIKKLAEKMIHLSGLKVKSPNNSDGDIEIVYTGIRPGEKLYEELFISENIFPTVNPLILSANEEMLAWSDLEKAINELGIAIDQNNHKVILDILSRVITEYRPNIETSDLLK